MLTNESIIAALSGEGDKKLKYSSAAVTNQESDKTCPVCNKTAHKYTTKTGDQGISKRVKDCPDFKSATDGEKQEMVNKLKEKHPVCSKCSGWSHKTEACNWKGSCSKCNEVHIQDLCTIKKFLSCSLSSGNNCCLMSLQDVPVHNSIVKACVMFDNGSEINLVSNSFAGKIVLPCEGV